MFNNNTTTWDGATAKVTVVGNAITAAEVLKVVLDILMQKNWILIPHKLVEELSGVTITSSGISTNVGDVVQITGVGTVTDGLIVLYLFLRHTDFYCSNNWDPDIVTNQYALHVAPSVSFLP